MAMLFVWCSEDVLSGYIKVSNVPSSKWVPPKKSKQNHKNWFRSF